MTRYAVVHGPRSGRRGAGVTGEMVVHQLRSHGHQVHQVETSSLSMAREASRLAVADGVDVLVAVGGDGVVQLAANAAAGSDTALGVIPSGTGNDNARSLGIPLDAEKAVHVLLAGQRRRIDLLHIESVDGQASATAMARFLLVLVNVLDAARNSLSFFLLLIVAMGYGVVRPVIGPAITRVRVLTALHFFFGVLYAVGLVLLLIDSKGAWIFMFVFPLIITLTIFLVWTLLSLRATIVHLTEKRQTHKCAMFQRLYLILAGAVIAVNAFFFASAFLVALSGSADFSTNSWKYRWIMLDGWLAVLYFVVFTLIAWLWRPTGQNMRLAVCCATRR